MLAYNQSMIETFYKTDMPEKGRSECYVLVLSSRPASERKVYVFMEEHGYWDDSLEKFLYEIISVSAEEDLNQQKALAMYNTSKRTLVQRGFIHTFAPDFHCKKQHEYQLLEPVLMSA